MACKISDGKIDAILEKLEDARLNASLANVEVRAFEVIPDFYACAHGSKEGRTDDYFSFIYSYLNQ